MSKKANPAVIGIFVVSGIVLAIGSVVVLGSGRFFAEVNRYVLFFEGSVKGLKVGSPVMFRGVEIGAVSDVSMRIDPEDLRVLIPVFVEVEVDRMEVIGDGSPVGDVRENVERFVAKGLRAQLELQNLLTGQLVVQFDFHPDTPVELVGIHMGVPELPTIPTPIQQVAKTLETLDLKGMVDEIRKAMETLSSVVASPEMAEGVHSLPVILNETKALVRDLRREIAPVLAGAEQAFRSTDRLAANLDRRTEALTEDLHGAVKAGGRLVERIDARIDPLASEAENALEGGAELMGAARDTLQTLDSALVRAASAMEKMDTELDVTPQLRHEVRTALEEISAAARSIRELANLLLQRPDALIRGRASGR